MSRPLPVPSANAPATDSGTEDLLILVDEADREIGTLAKTEGHLGAGTLHRAFSVFLFDAQGSVLIQQRAAGKMLWPGYWSNACCSHPRPGEAVELAARRRVREELHVECHLNFLYKFRYQARFGDVGAEHELCYVYAGYPTGNLKADPTEIADCRWIAPDDLTKAIAANPDHFSPWMKLEWERITTDFLDSIRRDRGALTMANVVITGSTRGIGRGLAVDFLKRGHNVAVSSRRQADVDKAVTELAAVGAATGARATGKTCDVTVKTDVQALWDHAVATFGHVDFWINNAGRATSRHAVHDLPEDLVHTLVDGNLKGSIFGSQVAMTGFRKQGFGALYNMLGGSSDGKRLTPNMGVYSSTKAGDRVLTKYLVAENQNPEIIIGTISPGMLITENWFDEQKQMSAEDWQKIRPTLNILCDYVETSTPWLVDEILANRKSGKRIAWMSTGKILGRFVGAKLFGQKRDLFTRFGL